MKCESSPGCIQAALHILGDQWSPLLIKEIAERGPQCFSKLEDYLSGISPRTLSQRLEHLLNEQIITRQTYCQRPPRYAYELTDKGRDLIAVLRAMANWGEKHSRSA